MLGSGVVSLLLKIFNMIMGVGLSVLLARALGAESYGIYSFAFALISVLAVPTQAGLPTLLVREVARYDLDQRWQMLKGVVWWSSKITILFSGFVMLIAGGWAFWKGTSSQNSIAHYTFLWALMLMPLIALGNLRGAALRGLRWVILGQFPEMILRPGLLIVLVTLGWHFNRLDPMSTMALHLFCSAIAFVVGALILAKALPAEVAGVKPTYDSKRWLSSLYPLSLLSGIHVINSNADLLMLGTLAGKEAVGIYRIAIQGSSIVSFGLYAVGMIVSPHFARLYFARKMAELQKLVTLSARLNLIIALPICLIFLFFGHFILAMVFGAPFETGSRALSILCVGQLINAGVGAVGTLLNMSGHERCTLIGVGAATLANVILNLVLIPIYGIEGAAVASVTSFAIWNLILWRFVRQKLGIESFVIGRRISLNRRKG